MMCSIDSSFAPSPLITNFCVVVVVATAVVVVVDVVVLVTRFLIGLLPLVGRLIGASKVRLDVVVVVLRAAATTEAGEVAVVVVRFTIGAPVGLEIGARAAGLYEI